MPMEKPTFCTIVCFDEKDFADLQSEYGKYCISVTNSFDNQANLDFPTLLVGWHHVKFLRPESRISKKKIGNNLFWTFSSSEDNAQQKKDIDSFLRKSLKSFLPKTYRTLDLILNPMSEQKFESLFDGSVKFIYFGKNCSLYMCDENGLFGISLNSIAFTGLSVSEFLSRLSTKTNLVFLNYENLPSPLKGEDIKTTTIENVAWVCSAQNISETSLFKFSPFVTNERYMAFFMGELYRVTECHLSRDQAIMSRCSKKDFVTDWLSSRKIHFSDGTDLVLRYSNKRTITGRINCVDKRFNPQLLPKKSPERERMVSRHRNGRIAVFDYVSFETRLSVLLTKDADFIRTASGLDLHRETAKIVFGKKEVDSNERGLGKRINHSIIYGIGNDRLSALMVENGFDATGATKKIKEVKAFLSPILSSSREVFEQFKSSGHIINPYGTVVHPQKEWAAYNNYVQSTAADFVVDKLLAIRRLIAGARTEFMYQVYDSFVFDVHPEELAVVGKIKELLERAGANTLQVDFVLGNTLMDCTSQKEFEESGAVD